MSRSIATAPITVLLATRNEAINLPKCLERLRPASKIIVLDSNSIDRSRSLARKAGAQVVQFKHKGGYPKKRQWALDTLKIKTPWVLLIDADEEVTPELWAEIRGAISSPSPANAYLIKKEFHFLGQKFRFGGFSFEAVLLFKQGKARFERLLDDPPGGMDMEVHERLIVEGSLGRLRAPLVHNDFKGLEAYIERHNKYADWEARLRYQLLTTSRYGLDSIQANLFGNPQERRRFLKKIAVRVPFEPFFWFLYHYIFRLGFLEGRPGFIASQIRSNYISQVRSKVHILLKNES